MSLQSKSKTSSSYDSTSLSLSYLSGTGGRTKECLSVKAVSRWLDETPAEEHWNHVSRFSTEGICTRRSRGESKL